MRALVVISILIAIMAAFTTSSLSSRMICHMARQDRQGHRGCLDNVTRVAVLKIINGILERDLPAAIDRLKRSIGAVHVPA